MNNRGQTLVLFVILIPVIIFLFVCFYQFGMLKIEEHKLENSIKTALEYGIDNLEKEDLDIYIKEMIMSNHKDIEEKNIEVYVQENELNIKVTKEYSVTFIMSDNKVFDYTIKNYNDNIEIIENRG